mmetsp:Transcript_13863/g.20983  ORF Transcript_13863/g.20983 Transcript_13863/m.20983 type:complete len:234 (+) Transcript_13863:143-844(+)
MKKISKTWRILNSKPLILDINHRYAYSKVGNIYKDNISQIVDLIKEKRDKSDTSWHFLKEKSKNIPAFEDFHSNDWKAEKLTLGATNGFQIKVNAPFSDLHKWLKERKKVDTTFQVVQEDILKNDKVKGDLANQLAEFLLTDINNHVNKHQQGSGEDGRWVKYEKATEPLPRQLLEIVDFENGRLKKILITNVYWIDSDKEKIAANLHVEAVIMYESGKVTEIDIAKMGHKIL